MHFGVQKICEGISANPEALNVDRNFLICNQKVKIMQKEKK